VCAEAEELGTEGHRSVAWTKRRSAAGRQPVPHRERKRGGSGLGLGLGTGNLTVSKK
jgi:hypothetical protein